WAMDGTTRTSVSTVSPTVDLGWKIQGIGDFGGDGKADILLRNQSTRQVVIWMMNGATILAGSGATPLLDDSRWAVRGVGDFNGDGKSDILWRQDASGQVVVWLMDGLTIAGSSLFALDDLSWDVAGVADVNGDAKADI